ncbi:uncharacterized protein LOC135395395 [Ornithodoros turicata]|uniref:uncharacterized protein LOC135395395 n=1 Tax=Ornithodoros turicata TaxID=34597 RepID=UPI003138D0EB
MGKVPGCASLDSESFGRRKNDKSRVLGLICYAAAAFAFAAAVAIIINHQPVIHRQVPFDDQYDDLSTARTLSTDTAGTHGVTLGAGQQQENAGKPVEMQVPHGGSERVVKKVCDTEDCHYMRRLIELSVNTSKDPCDNFFTFVCEGINEKFAMELKGGLMNSVSANLTLSVFRSVAYARIPPVGQTAFEKVAAFYQSCADPQDRRAIRRTILRFLTANNMDVTRNMTFHPLFKQVEFMWKDWPLIFGMSPVFFRRYGEVALAVKATRGFEWFKAQKRGRRLQRKRFVAKILGFVFRASGVNGTTINEILRAEDKVLKIARRQHKEAIHVLPMRYAWYGLDKNVSSIWNEALQNYSNTLLPGNYSMYMSMTSIRLFLDLFGTNPSIRATELRTFLAWSITRFLYNASGLIEPMNRTSCFLSVMKVFPKLGPLEVLRKTVNESRVARVEEMAQNIFNEIQASFNTSVWLDTKTRKGAVDKLSQLNKFIGYPLERYSLADVPDLNGPFIANLMSLNDILMDQIWRLILQPNATTFLLQATFLGEIPLFIANAAYAKMYNALYISPGIMYRPIFTYGGPPEVNYGALGRIMTHEMMHGYDVDGRGYDGKGDRVQWFTDKSEEAFNVLAKCHKDSIEGSPKARHFAEFPDEYLADTMGEGSLLSAYQKASQRSTVTLGKVKNLTSDELFYVAWCLAWCGTSVPDSNHPPLDERCNVPFLNSEHFSAVFGCAAGAPMNPPKKCHFW